MPLIKTDPLPPRGHNKSRDQFSTREENASSFVVHGPDRVTVPPSPPPGQSETKFFLLLGPLPCLTAKICIYKKRYCCDVNNFI